MNAIRQALKNLQSAAHALSQHVQRGGGGAAPGASGGAEGQAPSGDGKKEDVIDAEFEVKK